MPSPSPDIPRESENRPDPAACTREELLHKLDVDPAVGLSHKEAERRRLRSTAKPLFASPAPRFSRSLKRAFREPLLWLLLAVAVIALFFDRVGLGLVCVLAAGGHALLCALLAHRTARTDAAMQGYDAPLSRVLRARRIRRIGAAGVVPGDILMLYPGDVVPADCRLLRTEHFTVSERELDAADPHRPMTRLYKNADITPAPRDSYRFSPENMAFAGGVVQSGFALAVAVAVGSDTHLGALVGSVASPAAGKCPEVFRLGTRGFFLYNLIMVVLIIPLVAVGILTLGDRLEFLDIFLSAAVLASIGLSEHLLMKGRYLAAHIRRDAAMDRDHASSTDIKTSAAAEKLTMVTDLLLLGTAALHDGQPHPVTLQIDDRIYHCDRPEADEDAAAVAEWLFVYGTGVAMLPTSEPTGRDREMAALVRAVTEWAEMDVDAIQLRVRDIRPERDGASAIFSTPFGNQRLYVSLHRHPDELSALPRGAYDQLCRTHLAAVRTGLRAVIIAADAGPENGIGYALLTYSPHICPKTAGDIRGMEAAGIRVAAFLRDTSDENDRFLAVAGLTDTAAACHVCSALDQQPAVALLEEGVRAFTGCAEQDIADCIRALQAEGRTVAVLSADDRDLPLLHLADLAITCAPSLFATAEADIPCIPDTAPYAEILTGADGDPDAAVASDLCRRRADIVVRRTEATGGGVCGIRRALLSADRLKDTLDTVLAYLLLSQAARFVLTLLAVCYGMTALSAPALFLSGSVVDTVVLLWSGRLILRASPAPRRSMSDGFTDLWRTYRVELIIAASAALLPIVAVQIAQFAGVELGARSLHYLLLCLLALQTAVFLGVGDRARRRERRADSVPFFMALTMILVYVGALAVALGAGLSPLWALVFPLIPALICWVALRIADRKRR